VNLWPGQRPGPLFFVPPPLPGPFPVTPPGQENFWGVPLKFAFPSVFLLLLQTRSSFFPPLWRVDRSGARTPPDLFLFSFLRVPPNFFFLLFFIAREESVTPPYFGFVFFKPFLWSPHGSLAAPRPPGPGPPDLSQGLFLPSFRVPAFLFVPFLVGRHASCDRSDL